MKIHLSSHPRFVRIRTLFSYSLYGALFLLLPFFSFAQPGNDLCGNAITLTSAVSCVTTSGTANAATVTGGDPGSGTCGGTVRYDVWYKFTAQSTTPTITLSGVGAQFLNPRIQILSGACGGLSILSCGASPLTASGLTVGTQYYVRLFSTTNPVPVATGGFSICITDPPPAEVEFSKSYINTNKSSVGGTVAPGDTLEIRATVVVISQAIDSIAFFDTIYKNKGVRLVPNSISLRTNEDVLYKGFTDLVDADAGKVTTFGASPDTAIRMNIGMGSSSVARGKLRSTSKPSFYDKTCVLMATYKVVVYAPYDTKINFGGGAFTFLDTSTGAAKIVAFKSDSIMVYESPGLCPNSVSAANAIGVEANGTFGAPATGAPLARNRSTSAFVPNYTYDTFSQTSGPDDYYYGITNNTSSRFSIINTWKKPDNNSPNYRQFGKWDISGDHTGAINQAKGNPPCDTTKPISATNPCGYMLVINSSFRTDTAFRYSVTNLCPNTYYELSAWIKNICSFCSCDSNGNPANNGAFLPSVTGDSSGVQPNLAFEINGTDYYTTGNIKYQGARGPGSDSTNNWAKRGFVYKTGPAETSFILAIRNNAPGGAGNDWAIDDISLATCIPDMNYYPSTAAVCKQNARTIYDTVSSFYNNYTYYKWQKSTDGGVTWTDISPATGPVTPTFNASANAWQYLTHFVIPPGNTNTGNNGDRYRVVAATTSGNLSTTNCIVTDGVSFLTLNVINCGIPLATDLFSFNGKLIADKATLSWSVSQEDEPVKYQVERSDDGTTFFVTGIVDGYNNGRILNEYSFTDPISVFSKAFYRLTIVGDGGRKKVSRIIQLNGDAMTGFTITNIVNPFANELVFDLIINDNKQVDATLLDMSGKPVKKKSYSVYAGVNNMRIENTESLKPGMYLLQVTDKETIVTRKIVKK